MEATNSHRGVSNNLNNGINNKRLSSTNNNNARIQDQRTEGYNNRNGHHHHENNYEQEYSLEKENYFVNRSKKNTQDKNRPNTNSNEIQS